MLTPWSAQIHTKFHVHRITQEIPRCARVFGYGPFTLYGAAFQKLHLTFALPHRAPTTPPATSNRVETLHDSFLQQLLHISMVFQPPLSDSGIRFRSISFVVRQAPHGMFTPMTLQPGPQVGAKTDVNALFGRMFENVNVIHGSHTTI